VGVQFISASGGVKGRPAGACAPSVNPCAPAVPDWQAVVNAAPVFRISQYSFSHQHSNRGQLFGAHDTRRQDI